MDIYKRIYFGVKSLFGHWMEDCKECGYGDSGHCKKDQSNLEAVRKLMAIAENNPRLENWSFCFWFFNPYRASEMDNIGMIGEVYEDKRNNSFDSSGEFVDGHRIRTTTLKKLDLKAGVAQTQNTTYRLGKMNPKFSKWMEENGYTLEQYEKAINTK